MLLSRKGAKLAKNLACVPYLGIAQKDSLGLLQIITTPSCRHLRRIDFHAMA